MVDALEREATAQCRQVGHATMLVGVLPALAAIAGPVSFVLLGEEGLVAMLLKTLCALVVAGLMVGLGYALRQGRSWSFRAAAAVFSLVAVGGGLALVFGRGKIATAFPFLVMLPLAFVAAALRAERTTKKAQQAKRGPAAHAPPAR